MAVVGLGVCPCVFHSPCKRRRQAPPSAARAARNCHSKGEPVAPPRPPPRWAVTVSYGNEVAIDGLQALPPS